MELQANRSQAVQLPEPVWRAASDAIEPVIAVDVEAGWATVNAAAQLLLGCREGSALEALAELVPGLEILVGEAASRRFSILDSDSSESGARLRLRRAGRTAMPIGAKVTTMHIGGRDFAVVHLRSSNLGAPISSRAGRIAIEVGLDTSGPDHEVGVILVDLDEFGTLTSQIGSLESDLLVSEVSRLINESRREGELAAQLDSDSYALVADGDERSLYLRASEILETIRSTRFVAGGRSVRLTASAGVAQHRCGLEEGAQTLASAERALAEAKHRGKDTCSSRSRDAAGSACPPGLEEKVLELIRGQRFVAHFQPIIDLKSGQVSQYELLARLDDDGATISPAVFIPVAERLNQVGSIDCWAVRTAVNTLAERSDQLDGARIAINISGRSVGNIAILEELRCTIEETGVDPSRLVVELTETEAVRSVDDAASFGNVLRALGVGFALDDFGAGFGTLYYLKHLPFDQLKIDGEFIRGAAHSEQDRAMIATLVQMASTFEAQTVAEFVADAATLEVVRDLGVDHAQGFHIGRPGPLLGAH